METHTEVSSSPTKPMILISAKDVTSASGFITELTEDTAVKSNMEETNRRPWQIVNKYYRVDVEIYVLADNEPCPQELAEHVEAHIIFLADNEDGEAGEALAERRREAAAEAGADAGARAAVRLLLLDAPAAAAGLQSWARRRGYEPVPLRERADDHPERDPAAPFAETYGAERARAALHAHAWRGLQRLDRPARPPPALDPQPTSSDDDYEGLDDSDDEAAVERAEAFVEALGALGDARAPHELAPDERRRRAERLVAAFCRALGADLPAL